MSRRLISSAQPLEREFGYSRAVVADGRVYVSGTVARMEDGSDPPPDAYKQAQQCLRNIESALQRLGAGLEHIVRTRMYVTDISRWEEYGRAHGEVFREIMPATAMVEVKALIDPRMLIEIEADAEL